MAQNWKPNETQERFMKGLENGQELTLAEINTLVGGTEIKTGSINTLLTKGLVEHGEDKEVEVVVKRKVKTYRLVK